MSKSLYFNAEKSTYIELDLNAFDISKQYTSIIVFKPTEMYTQKYISIMSNSTNDNATGFTFDIELLNNKLQYWNRQKGYTILSNIEINKTYTLAITNNLNSFKFYLNGDLIHETIINALNCNTIIGGYARTSQNFNGNISYYKLYNKCLSLEDIREEQYSSKINDNIIRYYDFNEILQKDNNTYAIDRSNYKKDCIIHNFIKLDKDIISLNKYLINQDNQYYNIDGANLSDNIKPIILDKIDDIKFDSNGFNNLSKIFSNIKNNVTLNKLITNINLNKYISNITYKKRELKNPIVTSSPGLFEVGDGNSLIDTNNHTAYFNNNIKNGNMIFEYEYPICINGVILSWSYNKFNTGVWKFLASNDNKNYVTLLDSFEYGGDSTSKTYKFTNNTFYKYYKMEQIEGVTSRNAYLHDIIFIKDIVDYTLYGLFKYNNKFYSLNHTYDLIDININDITDNKVFKSSGFEISDKINFEKIRNNKDIELYLYYEDFSNTIDLDITYDVIPFDLFNDKFKLFIYNEYER